MTAELWSPIKLSIIVSLISTLFVSVVGTAIGYTLARYKFPGRNLLDAICTLPLVLPPTVVGFYLLGIFGKGGWIGRHLYALTHWTPVFTWQAAVIAAFVISLPLMVKTSRAAIESIDPAFEEVAYTLGKSRWQTIFSITLPMAWRGLLAGVALSLTRAFGEFGATLMLAGNIPGKTQTMPLAIYQYTQTGEDSQCVVLVAILSLLSVSVVYLLNKWEAKW